MLLSVASEDIPQGNEVRTAVKVSAFLFWILQVFSVHFYTINNYFFQSHVQVIIFINV